MKIVALRVGYIPALDILYYLHLHILNLSSFSSPVHHITTYILWSYYLDCSRPAVISYPALFGDIFIIPVYGTFILRRLSVNLRRGFSMGYFHIKSVPEFADAESTWDIFMSSRFLSLLTRNQRGIFS